MEEQKGINDGKLEQNQMRKKYKQMSSQTTKKNAGKNVYYRKSLNV